MANSPYRERRPCAFPASLQSVCSSLGREGWWASGGEKPRAGAPLMRRETFRWNCIVFGQVPKVGVWEWGVKHGNTSFVLTFGLFGIHYTNCAGDSKLSSMDIFQVHQLGVEIRAWGTSHDIKNSTCNSQHSRTGPSLTEGLAPVTTVREIWALGNFRKWAILHAPFLHAK